MASTATAEAIASAYLLADLAAGARDQRQLDDVAEVPRGARCGPVEQRLVGLVEVELALEHARERDPGHDTTAGAVEHPGDADAGDAEADREDGGDRLLPARRTDERLGDRLQPGLDRVPDGRELEPAADRRQHGEHANCPRHRPADDVAPQRVEVLAS